MAQATPQPEFCGGWSLTWEQAAGCCPPSGLGSLDEATQQEFIDRACEFLWRRTGRRYGRCTASVTLTPTHCGTHGVGCHCPGSGKRLDVPYVPVVSVEVTVDGTALVEGTDFELVNRSTLRHLRNYWPRWSTIDLTVTYGQDPPPELLVAAGVLAVNLAKLDAGTSCEFPPRTKTVSAENMTIEVANPDATIPEGLSGIPRVDQVIVALWPHGTRPAPGGRDLMVTSGWDEVTPSLEAP